MLSSENFRDGSLATLALAKRHQTKRWQIDLQQSRLFNLIDLHWFIQQGLLEACSGLTTNARVAVTLNDSNQFGKLGADLLIRTLTAINKKLICRYFVGSDDTYLWLMS